MSCTREEEAIDSREEGSLGPATVGGLVIKDLMFPKLMAKNILLQ